jgi:hypothetical protein
MCIVTVIVHNMPHHLIPWKTGAITGTGKARTATLSPTGLTVAKTAYVVSTSSLTAKVQLPARVQLGMDNAFRVVVASRAFFA